MQSQSEGFALIPPSAATEPCSGLPAGPEDEEELALEDARSSGGDGESQFLDGEDLALEANIGASQRAEVEQKGGSSDQVHVFKEPVEQPLHALGRSSSALEGGDPGS